MANVSSSFTFVSKKNSSDGCVAQLGRPTQRPPGFVFRNRSTRLRSETRVSPGPIGPRTYLVQWALVVAPAGVVLGEWMERPGIGRVPWPQEHGKDQPRPTRGGPVWRSIVKGLPARCSRCWKVLEFGMEQMVPGPRWDRVGHNTDPTNVNGYRLLTNINNIS